MRNKLFKKFQCKSKRGLNKRGQFYLIAAMVIVVIIIGYAAVSNYTKRKADVKIYNLAKELNIESGKVLEYGVYNEKNLQQMIDLTTHFTTLYTTYSGDNSDILFVIGNEGYFDVYRYGDLTTGTISVSTGVGSSVLQIRQRAKEEIGSNSIQQIGNKITVTDRTKTYEFELKKGENFYFVISQQIGEETYIVEGSDANV